MAARAPPSETAPQREAIAREDREAEQERKETQKGLEAAKGYIRREITEAVNLRVSPEVFFTFDEFF